MTDAMGPIVRVHMTPVSGVWLVDADWAIFRLKDPLDQAVREVVHVELGSVVARRKNMGPWEWEPSVPIAINRACVSIKNLVQTLPACFSPAGHVPLPQRRNLFFLQSSPPVLP